MKVGLFLSCHPELDYQRAPLGLGYLASYVQQHVPGVEFVIEKELDDLIAAKPDVVGITVLTKSSLQALRDAKRIKDELGCPIIGGGPHITALPTVMDPIYELAVLGEGELTFAELMQLYLAEGKFDPRSLAKIQGIVYRDESGQIQITEKRAWVEQLDTLPFPDREILCRNWPHPDGEYSIMTSRGCPYECAFCSTTQHWGRRYRFHSKEYVANEIQQIREKFNPTVLKMWDDLFVVNKKRVMELLAHIRERGLHEGMEFSCFVRANLMDEEMMESMAKTNFKVLNIGFEASTDELLNVLGKKGVVAGTNIKALDRAMKYGFELSSTFILGTPGETRADILASFDFVAANIEHFSWVEFVPLEVLPGTPVFEWARAIGISETNLEGVIWTDEDFADPMKFYRTKWAYLNEEKMSRDEVCTLIQIGKQLAMSVRKLYNARQEVTQLRSMPPRIQIQEPGLDFVAANVPFKDIISAKISRRFSKMRSGAGVGF